ncbi:hypothetical protein ACMA1D_18475 [Streptomyces sp. 796.1]|uniref:hypothetical protein n=1 Tax=Streptomyces sp. 796.1 TaxID=3163029 RepID=UPI0039C8F976
MRGLWARVWLRYVLVGALLAAGTTGYVVLRHERRAAQLADNQQQLEQACRGLLPVSELRPYLPADSAGELAEFGTLADGGASRSLYDCTLMWGASHAKWEPDALVRVHAVAALPGEEDRLSPPNLDDAVGTWRTPPGTSATLTYDSGLGRANLTAWLRVRCRGDLTGRVRPSRDLRISVELPVRADFPSDLTPAERLAPARTAVRAANWVTARQQHCAAPRLSMPTGVVMAK